MTRPEAQPHRPATSRSRRPPPTFPTASSANSDSDFTHPGNHGNAGDEVNVALHIRNLATTSPTGKSPTTVRTAYGFSQLTQDGTGQTIAIVDAYGSPTAAKGLRRILQQIRPAHHRTLHLLSAGNSRQERRLGPGNISGCAMGARHRSQGKDRPGVAKTASFSNLLACVSYAVNTLHAQQVSMSWVRRVFQSPHTTRTSTNPVCAFSPLPVTVGRNPVSGGIPICNRQSAETSCL